MNLPETIENTFLARFGEEPLLVRSPGIVNIIASTRITRRMNRKTAANALILAAMLIAVVPYGAAFYASDVGSIEGVVSSVVSVLMGITGFGMGILDVIGATTFLTGGVQRCPRRGQPGLSAFGC